MFMDYESRFGAGSNPSSSSNFSSAAASCSSTSTGSSATAVEDRMGNIELEAAEALADLGHLAMRESGAAAVCDSGSMWGCKGKRAMKRVKSESPPSDSGLNPVVDSVAAFSYVPSQDKGVVDQQQQQPQNISIAINPVKVEQVVNLTKPTSRARSYPTHGGGRCRQNLTEAEKEARRLRRILANRESARQTIRRRQALCEELTRKAADLAWENEKLKQEKQMVVKEYQSLEATNEQLKLQMNKVIKVEEEVSPLQLNLAPIEMPTSPTANCPMFLYNQNSFPQLCWSSIIHPSSSVQPHLGRESAVVVPQNIDMPSYGKPDSFQQPEERTVDVDGPRTSLYIMPCPWFFSVPDSGLGVHPQISFSPRIEVTSATNPGTGSSSSKSSVMVKSESFGRRECGLVSDLNMTPVGSPPEGIVDSSMTLGSATLDPIGATGPVESEFQCDDGAPCADTVYLKACQVSGMSEKDQDAIKFSDKRTTDAAAAAGARRRRRRKELMKLKYLPGNQCRRTLEL